MQDNDLHTRLLVMKTIPIAGKGFKNHKAGDVGFDLEVWQYVDPEYNKLFQSLTLPPKTMVWFSTGLRVKLSDNAWGIIRARSSLLRRGVVVFNSAIDPGYTGPIEVCLFNTTGKDITFDIGERVAQIIPVPRFDIVEVKEVKEMPKTERGDSGFGSTGR